MTFVAGQTKLPKRGSMGRRRQAACVLFVVSSCLDHTKGFAVSTGTVAWQSAFGFTRSTHVRRCSRLESIATPTTGVDASDGSGTSATSYSPSELIEALRDASAQSRPLGVERIFSVLSEHRGFMNEVRHAQHSTKFAYVMARERTSLKLCRRYYPRIPRPLPFYSFG